MKSVWLGDLGSPLFLYSLFFLSLGAAVSRQNIDLLSNQVDEEHVYFGRSPLAG